MVDNAKNDLQVYTPKLLSRSEPEIDPAKVSTKGLSQLNGN